jgi:NitT/TauT family transport system permease protein
MAADADRSVTVTEPTSSDSWRALALGVAGVVLFALAWEIFARSRVFAPALTPTLAAIGAALGRMLLDGSLFGHVAFTLYRVLSGLVLAAVVGIPLGMLMGRHRPVERFFLPLMSVLMPIPSLAWVPVFILWFGLGNTATIMLVFYAATFPLMYNTWTGVRTVNRLWLRAASAMGADERALFWKVVLPGSLPFVITGLRQAFARSWIAVVGGEMIAASAWGLGWVIFDAKEFLNTDVMLGVLVVIGGLGLVFERVLFQALEARSVARWGMLRSVRA